MEASGAPKARPMPHSGALPGPRIARRQAGAPCGLHAQAAARMKASPSFRPAMRDTEPPAPELRPSGPHTRRPSSRHDRLLPARSPLRRPRTAHIAPDDPRPRRDIRRPSCARSGVPSWSP
jgi:hypothetical protein